MSSPSGLRAAKILALVLLAPALTGCLSFVGTAGPPTAEPTYATGAVSDGPLPTLRTEGLSAEEIRTVGVYRTAVRGVVNITAVQLRTTRFGRAVFSQAIGSGFIIDEQAHVVTNNHVVEGATQVTVTLYDGSAYPGEVVGADPELDVAVVRFDPQGRALTELRLGDSSLVQVGQQAYALGSPFGLEGTLTVGIVSGLNRPVPSESGFIIRDLIQTDTAINTGNSGGPLLNSSGEVIGINVLILSPTGGSVGVGFAIPANSARRVIDGLLADGRIDRGWIEMSGLTVTARLAAFAGLPSAAGVLVTNVTPGGNAEAAGLRDGRNGPVARYGLSTVPVTADIIVGVNGTEVHSAVELLSLLEPTEPGETITLTVVRGGERVDLSVILTERPTI